MTMTMTQLQVDKIETNAGYTIIQDSKIFLPTLYNFSLHIIDLNQIETIITELKTSISILPKYLGNPLTMNIDKIEDKLKTISNGHHNINKRGLFNFLGRVNKWISGSMDDEDREIINQHFEITDTNNQQITNNFNEQIKINENFNKSINNLYMSICEDRKIIQTFIQRENTKLTDQMMKYEIKQNIQEIDQIITNLQDNIIFSNINIIHPSLLTHEEIINFKINSNKIKCLKVGFSTTTTNKLIFLVKIPHNMIEINKKIIIPLTNTQTCEVIKTPVTPLLEYKNKYYEYDESKTVIQLNNLKHCILHNNCDLIQNCNTEIYNIDDSSMIIQLSNKMTLSSNCDERKFELTGNYFIKFFNCTIKLDNQTYYNNIRETHNRYIIPHITQNPNKTVTFNDILLENNNNLQEIKLLKYYKQTTHITIYIIITIVIIFIITSIYTYIKCKPKEIHITNKIQENLHSKEGRVIYTPHSLDNIPLHTITNTLSHDQCLSKSDKPSKLNTNDILRSNRSITHSHGSHNVILY